MRYPIDPTSPLAAQLHAHDLYVHRSFRDGRTILYRFWDASGRLLYVGITINPGIRWQRHKNVARWWTAVSAVSVETYPHTAAAEDAERAAIKTECPKYNIRSASFTAPLTEQGSEPGSDPSRSLHCGIREHGSGSMDQGIRRKPVIHRYGPFRALIATMDGPSAMIGGGR